MNNKMKNMAMPKLAINMALPMIISMMFLALYNIVDSMFVSQVDGAAFTALSIVSPVQSIMIAISLGTGVGISSLVARKLGANDTKDACKTIANGITIMILMWAILALIGSIFSYAFMNFFSNDEATISYGSTYLSICMIFGLGNFLQILSQKVMEAFGKTTTSMIIQFTGAAINIILDPIFIWGFGIIPAMGVAGAAIATATSQFIGMLIGIHFIKKLNLDIKIEDFKLDKSILMEIYIVGFPTIVLESLSAFVTLILNKIFLFIYNGAIDIWGAYNRVQSFLFMIVYGLNNAMIPIVAYNYGAKDYARVRDAIKVFLIYAEIVMFIGMIVFMTMPGKLLEMFNVADDTVRLGSIAFRILASSFFFSGVSLILSGTFQATGNGKNSLIIFLLRQLSINVPLIYILGKYVNVEYMWLAFWCSELLAMSVSIILYSKNKTKIYDNPTEQ